MDSITLENFRCFRAEQEPHLAPLTLLVGENSTGKTSFLALIRALWDVAFGQKVPDFKADPYDLGSFDEIAYQGKNTESNTDQFKAGFEMALKHSSIQHAGPYKFVATFEKSGTIPVPTSRTISLEEVSVKETYHNGRIDLAFKTGQGEWHHMTRERPRTIDLGLDMEDRLFPLYSYLRHRLLSRNQPILELQPTIGSPDFSDQDLDMLQNLIKRLPFHPLLGWRQQTPFASAPVRSKPQRTYDPSSPKRDPEGDYAPMYLAKLFSQNKEMWNSLQDELEAFGKSSGLFDKILIEPLGKHEGGPFQINISMFNKGNGTQRNLIDVGYGVSQALPLITELLRKDSRDMFLIQQPEVHLHPRAQAALGSLFCQVAGKNKQLIVETHSDYILDRVRMDIRDQTSPLKPEDVSLLFFERKDLDVEIHSLKYDEQGNVLGTPMGYRQFFMDETRRFLNL